MAEVKPKTYAELQLEQKAQEEAMDKGIDVLRAGAAVFQEGTEYSNMSTLLAGGLEAAKGGLGGLAGAKTLFGATSWAVPVVGWGAATLAIGASLYKSLKKRKEIKAQRERLNKRWQAAVKKYKEGLSKGIAEAKKSSQESAKTAGKLTLGAIVGKEMAAYNKLIGKSAAISSQFYKDRAKTKEAGLATLEDQENKYSEKLALLADVANLLEKEKSARRSIEDGVLQTDYVHDANAKLQEAKDLGV